MSVESCIEQNMNRLLPAGIPSVLIAFSGGADSSLLLNMAYQYGLKNHIKVYAAHINHRIRGEEANADQAFCEAAAETLHIPCFSLVADIPSIASENKAGLEETARAVRYDYFRQIMSQYKIPVLLTAHNSDDQLETILFRLVRGTGTDGLCGICEVRRFAADSELLIVRPMLSITKRDILETCSRLGISYVQDKTNSDIHYARNRIRHKVIPELEQLFAIGTPQMNAYHLSRTLAEDTEYLNRLAAQCYKDSVINNTVSSELSSQPVPIRKRVIQSWLSFNDAYAEYDQLNDIDRLLTNPDCKEPMALSLPGGKTVYLDRGRLYIKETHTAPVKSPDWSCSLPELMKLGQMKIGFAGLVLSCGPSPDNCAVLYRSELHLNLPADKYLFTLRCSGDKILSHGHHKDIRKCLSASKIPLCYREFIPVLHDPDNIVWVPFIGECDGLTRQTTGVSVPLVLYKEN